MVECKNEKEYLIDGCISDKFQQEEIISTNIYGEMMVKVRDNAHQEKKPRRHFSRWRRSEILCQTSVKTTSDKIFAIDLPKFEGILDKFTEKLIDDFKRLLTWNSEGKDDDEDDDDDFDEDDDGDE
nr:hypothetical transcript [Hymenolepis microstoma]